MWKGLKKGSRYLPVLGFVVLLLSSWFLLQNVKSSSQEDIHKELQEKVQEAISNYVITYTPHITGITFHKVWTQKTSSPTVIKIFFSYTLVTDEEAPGSLLIDGEALLSLSDKNKYHWMLSDFKVTNSLLEFSKPMVIKFSEK